MKTILTIAFAFAMCVPLQAAAVVYVDFGDANNGTVPATGTDFYNVTPDQVGISNAVPLASGGTISLSNLLTSNSTPTTTDITISAYNETGEIRSGNANPGVANTENLVHDPVAPFEEFASGDGYWMNNHNSSTAGTAFGFVISFSDLVGPSYDITLLAGHGSNLDGTWSVTTGTGDSDAEAFSGQDDVLSWTQVAPVGGVITLTGATISTTQNFRNASISAVSITAIPEPGCFALIGLVGGVAAMRRRR